MLVIADTLWVNQIMQGRVGKLCIFPPGEGFYRRIEIEEFTSGISHKDCIQGTGKKRSVAHFGFDQSISQFVGIGEISDHPDNARAWCNLKPQRSIKDKTIGAIS